VSEVKTARTFSYASVRLHFASTAWIHPHFSSQLLQLFNGCRHYHFQFLLIVVILVDLIGDLTPLPLANLSERVNDIIFLVVGSLHLQRSRCWHDFFFDKSFVW
jgi:hypothetical protein